MVLDFSHLPRTQQMLVYEANIRGAYISISCDSERLMDDLVALCELGKIFPTGLDEKTDDEIIKTIIAYKVRLITSLEMGKKLDRCQKGLKNYNQNYFEEFNKHFTVIADLVKDRNLMAHGYTDFDIHQNPNQVLILFENVERGKKKEKVIDFQPFIMQLERYRSVIMELLELVVRLRIENFGNRNIV